AGRRPRRARRHVPARMPATPRDAHRRHPQAPRAGPGHQAGRQPPRRDRGAGGQRPARPAHLGDEGPAAMSDDDKRSLDKSPVEQPAVEQSPENVPAPTGEVRAVGERRGMFGVSGTGDTSGYGGLVKSTVFPAPAQRPYGGWFDEVVDALEERLSSTDLSVALEGVVIHRGEITFH